MFTRIFFALFLFVFVFSINSQTYHDSPSDFFFSDEVGGIPMLMSPGFISTGMNEESGTLSPKGDEFYYCLTHQGDISVILVTRFIDGFWTYPDVAEFSGKYQDSSPFIGPSGEYLYFVSDRPVNGTDRIRNWSIWRCLRVSDNEWSEPELMPFCSGEQNEMSVSVDRDGVVYFHADYESETISLNRDAFDIFCVRPAADNEWDGVEKLGSAINSSGIEEYPAISPDGNSLVFSSERSSIGKGDLYVSFREGDGWSEALSLGRLVNSSARDYCPAFTNDGLLLFVSSRRNSIPGNLTYSELKRHILGPGNGRGDIWYINASVLEDFRVH